MTVRILSLLTHSTKQKKSSKPPTGESGLIPAERKEKNKMEDEEEKYYTRLECTFAAAVVIAKVLREDKIAIKHFWNVSEEVSK
jgi:hypothetical protein